MKKIMAVLLVALLALSTTGCWSIVDDITDSLSDETSTTTGGVSAEDGYAEGRLGDVMHTYFFDYTVNSAYTCASFEDYTPESGNHLLVANVTVKNTNRASIEMYDTDFQAQWGDDSDDAYRAPITYYGHLVSDEQLPDTYELGVDESKTGLLVFEVPEGTKDFSISYLEVFSDDSEGDTFFVYFTASEK